jgi:iron complex transport system substrate-binding protein
VDRFSREGAKARRGRVRSVEELTALAIDCGLQIHRELGPGLLESVYEAVLAHTLTQQGVPVVRQMPVPITFRGQTFTDAFRADLVVDGRLIIEIKSVERQAPVHAKQLLTYLRLMEQPIGLLMNFGCDTFREGLKRVVNNHVDFAASRLRVNQ